MVIIFNVLIILCVIPLIIFLTQMKFTVVKFSFNDIIEMSDKDIEQACKQYPGAAFKIKVLRGIHNIIEKYNNQVDRFFDNKENDKFADSPLENIVALEYFFRDTKSLIKENLLDKVDPEHFEKKYLQTNKAWFFKTFEKGTLARIYCNIELIDRLLDGESLSKIEVDPIFERHYDNINKLRI